MARPAADRVKAVWTGTGTGTITLGGAAPGEPVQAFPSSLNGQTVRYLIRHETAQEAESGYGVYTHSGTTLSRLFRTYPTFGGSAVSFSAGTKFVAVTSISIDSVPNLATVDPTTADNSTTGFLAGQIWINTSADTAFILVDDGSTATWLQLGGAASLDQYDILARLASGSGTAAAIAAVDLTEKVVPVAGDFLLGWSLGTNLVKVNVGNLPSSGDIAPTRVPSTTATFPLTPAARLHSNVIVTSHQANVIFEVPQSATANSEWRIMPVHDGCTVTINGALTTITPNPARIINGGLVIVTVVSNAGSAPVVQVRGEVIVPSTSVTTKTYDLDDYAQDFSATGIQTFSMTAATIPNGYYVNIWNATAGNLTVDGLDADHIIPANGVVTVKKRGDGALVCNGAGGNTVLDAA